MADKKTMIVVTQLKGLSHKPLAQRLILKGLGLRRIGHTVTVRDTPAIRGMIEKVQHLVNVEVRYGEAPLFGGRHRDAEGKPSVKTKKAAKADKPAKAAKPAAEPAKKPAKKPAAPKA